VKRSSVAHFNCSIAQTLEIVGEWWTPLVLRNIMMGQRRFEQIQADLGIARNILSDRLSTLVDAGVLTREQYQDAPVRYEYRLTEMGSDLFGSLMALMAWGDRWLSPDGPPVEVLHKDCGEVTRPVVACEHCHGELTRRNVRVRPGAGWRPPTGVTLPASV
jgi:DNA-binding HxlR family transcriptional regulator